MPARNDSLRISIIGALLIAAMAGAGLGAYYRWIGGELRDIDAKLVPEQALANPGDPDTKAAIEGAKMQCARLYDLRANPVARRLRGGEIGALWDRCQKIADIDSGLDKIGKAH